jgi:hypothetical protein
MAIVIEDGTGVSTAESYISVAAATTYFANFGSSDAWLALEDQEVALRRATRDLDALYGMSYVSDRLTTTQALLWPREAFTDNLGRTTTGLPAAVAQAVAELALINATADSTGEGATTGNVKRLVTKLDVLEKSTEFFAPTTTTSTARRKVSILLAPYLIGGTGLYARVVRG